MISIEVPGNGPGIIVGSGRAGANCERWEFFCGRICLPQAGLAFAESFARNFAQRGLATIGLMPVWSWFSQNDTFVGQTYDKDYSLFGLPS